jgi:hypothetical protein
MVQEDLGELDKSGIAELTFKDCHKNSAIAFSRCPISQDRAYLAFTKPGCDLNARMRRVISSIVNPFRDHQLYLDMASQRVYERT